MEAQLGALRGESVRIVAIRAQVAQLLARQTGARRFPPILILGETGTGKGLLTRTIHEAGPRRAGPFVDVNCAAIPETLLEAELFGYERGAFTDARQAKPGLFQTAHGGTLFLDEIGLLPVALQSKLLTVLEDRAVRRLGSTRAEPVDVTLVAATSVDLKRAVADGRFREDLYHRLAVITLELPPLRSRGADVLVLADHFLACACADYGLSPRVLTPDARDLLAAHRWPGNVRELANAMERVVLLSETDEIPPAMLGFLTNDAAQTMDAVGAAEARDADAAGSLDDALRARIEAGLRDTGGKIRRTAAALGISRNTLRARMDKYGLRHHDTPPAASRKAPELPAAAHQPVPMQWEHRHLAFLRVRLLTSRTVEASRALEVVGEKVRSFGGRIEEASPTGVIAVFGLEPLDNAPSHAALAALAIQKAAAHARVAGGAKVEIVSAIHCADLLVGRQEAAIQVGVDGKAATWSLLETLVADETQGAIVVSGPAVPFLARRFALEPLRDTRWLLLHREEASAGWNVTRFVGRTPELHTLHQAASRVEQRHGQLVGIVGEAGVGKSRLAHEVARRLQGWLVLSSGGAPYAKNTPYFPLVDLFKGFWHIQDTDTMSEVRERVARALPAGAGDPDLLLAPMLDLLGVLPLTDAFRDLDPRQRRQRTDDAIKQVLLAASIPQPLCLIIEDLQWIDAATQEVLDRFVTSMAAVRVLLVVNYRPEYEHPWSNKTYYSQLRLDALAAESTRELLDALLGEDPTLEPLKQRLVRRGNPFFLEESVRTLAETGVIVGEGGRYRLGKPMAAIQVPSTVQAVLAARIDRLSVRDKRLLQSAAVIGKDVPFILLQAIGDASPEELRTSLRRLQAAEFLYETDVFHEVEYTFKHALTHDVAYGSLLHEQRRLLHARIVDAIERLHSGRLSAQVERMAHHAVQGEVWDKAVAYCRQAGAKAMTRSAYSEAAARFEQALDALRNLPESRSRTDQAIELHFDASRTLLVSGVMAKSMDHARQAEVLATSLGDERRRGQALVFLMHRAWNMGDSNRALELGQEALAIGVGLHDASLEMSANQRLGAIELTRGDYRQAAERLRRVTEQLQDGGRHERVEINLTSVNSRDRLVWCLTQLGEFTEAMVRAEEAIRIALEVDHPSSLVFAHRSLGLVSLRRGDLTQAIAPLERAVELCRVIPAPLLFDIGAAHLGYAYSLSGRLQKGLALMEEALAEPAVTGSANHPLFLAHLAEAHLLAGRRDEAIAVARRALDLAQLQKERGNEAWIQRVFGEISAQADPPDLESAEGHYGSALTRAAELGMRPLVAHCHLGLGKLCRRTGRRQEAHEHLSTATTMYREMGMTYWLEQVAGETAALA